MRRRGEPGFAQLAALSSRHRPDAGLLVGRQGELETRLLGVTAATHPLGRSIWSTAPLSSRPEEEVGSVSRTPRPAPVARVPIDVLFHISASLPPRRDCDSFHMIVPVQAATQKSLPKNCIRSASCSKQFFTICSTLCQNATFRHETCLREGAAPLTAVFARGARVGAREHARGFAEAGRSEPTASSSTSDVA